MKKNCALFIISLLAVLPLKAQVSKYRSEGWELIHSFSEYNVAGKRVDNRLRFSAFFHINQRRHFDFGKSFGVFTGFAVRNVGFIARESDSLTVKRRVYTMGVPLAFKVGNMSKMIFFYAGGEAELAINYKEKHFVDRSKEKKFNEWFSERTPLFMPSVFAGFQNKKGFNLCFKYYLNNFFNTGFSDKGVKPYTLSKANVFYVSASYSRKNRKSARTKGKTTDNPVTLAR